MAGLVQQEVKAQGPQDPKARSLPPEVLRVVIAAKKILAQPEIAKRIIAMMQAAGDPAKGIAQATVFLIKQLVETSKRTIPPKAILPAAQEIMSDVAKLGVSAKLFQFSPELIQQAATIVIQMIGQLAQSSKQAAPPAQPARVPSEAQAVPAPPAPDAAPMEV